MEYISTRGRDRAGSFKEVVLAGLAKDGGLFVPVEYPRFSPEKISTFKSLKYHELAFEIIFPFVGDSIPAADLKKILESVYSTKNFHHKDIAPVKKLADEQYLLELFHGPTLAFKDFALQLLGQFFDYFLQGDNSKVNILGATSGDTGSAAIAGCAGHKNVNVFILHPYGKVSEVQRRQMTTIPASNVFNIAIKGNFDDCQNIVKEIFNDLKFKDEFRLTAVNSINWARIVAQIVYYFYAYIQIGSPKKISFSVPTGNFGDILAGYIAWRMGLPVDKLIIATNSNDILHRFMTSGIYKKAPVVATTSPSMDIQISSNFERLLFEYESRDAINIRNKINELSEKSQFSVEKGILSQISQVFVSCRADDKEVKAEIAKVYKSNNELLDPHSAIGYIAAQAKKPNSPVITLATAHPAKFPDAVKAATGKQSDLPEHLKSLFALEERYKVLESNAVDVESYIRQSAK